MKKPLKVVAIVLGILVGLVLLAVVALMIFVDPNRYRDDIIQAVKTKTGRDLKIDGPLRLSFLPLGVGTEKLELANAKGFGPEPFARIDSANISVEIWPLLHKQVVVDTIRFDGLALHLERAADGRNNWQDLAAAKKTEQPAPTPTPSAPNAGAALAVFTINHFEVKNSEFTWRDRVSGSNYALRRVELTSGNLLGDAPAPLHLAFDLESGKPPVHKRVSLDARLHLNAETEVLDVPELKLALGDLRLNAALHGKDVLHAPALNGRIDIPMFALQPLLKELNLPYTPADPKALQRVGLAAQLESNPQSLTISDLKLTLDESHLTGKFALPKTPKPSYRFDLAIDTIDIDRYLPPASTTDGKTNNDKTENAKAVVIPLALLRDADADGQFRIQQLKAFGIRSQAITLKVAAKDGHIVLGPYSAKLYNGSYDGRTTIDAAGSTPHFGFDEKLTGVQLGPFLKDADLFQNFSGVADIKLVLSGQGLDAAAIKKTLAGSVAATIKDGTIEGIDIGKIEAKIKEIKDRPGGIAQGLLGSLSELSPVKSDKTPFSKLQASAVINSGIVDNKDLVIDGPHLHVTGSGNINLVNDSFDNYVLRVSDIPVIISGPLNAPKFRPDLSAIVKGQVQEKQEKVEKKLEKKLGDKLERWKQKLQQQQQQ
ncbi:MAG: AsmA family protein [Gammaproteobacteria bacterium]|nr:AsmA family protein [Gammaproteobacteria bacterium]